MSFLSKYYLRFYDILLLYVLQNFGNCPGRSMDRTQSCEDCNRGSTPRRGNFFLFFKKISFAKTVIAAPNNGVNPEKRGKFDSASGQFFYFLKKRIHTFRTLFVLVYIFFTWFRLWQHSCFQKDFELPSVAALGILNRHQNRTTFLFL